MSVKTKKEVLVEYPIEVVYDTLIHLFPFKSYELKGSDDGIQSVEVVDSSNSFFIMRIDLMKNTPNSTVVSFIADYWHAAADLTGGGRKAIDMVLEGLLNKLDKEHKADYEEFEGDSDLEIVNAWNFVNPAHTEKNTKSIIAGYALCILSFLLPALGVIYYNQESSLMAIVVFMGVVCFALALNLGIILQYSENQKSKWHGRIQICICILWFIVAGILVHPGLAVAGVVILAILIIYFYKREKKYS